MTDQHRHGSELMDTERWLTRAAAAALAGIQRSTWSAYVSRGQAPQPRQHVGSTPLWDKDEVMTWARTRPGRGNRGTYHREDGEGTA